ncbi:MULTISPECIES: neutral zinc metallopeptidase [Hydrocarboniphaga]|uniref:Zinc metallopeptidase, putative n=1 Tax=Hydrocarboniphaga effusa AP103 TaxID=1172194 RepID=I7ZA36_9GAMM|nr:MULTISPECIES: neutral zinc metallopeptidase [Hydrocarboniphaga]EIT68714.1 zinc metallopeptidase, putative [Hydrocarboniphaga effusa AP103]MDZ4076942.1 neutral zinc metallopeptidase [Hydrocarboniphaga sp.]
MKWREGRRSGNVTGGGGGGGGLRLGLGGVAVVVVLGLLFGKSPMEMLGLVAQLEQGGAPTQQQPLPDNETTDFVRAILGSTEDVWSALFTQSGSQYQAPTLVLFSGSVQTACGGASSASGPFYCPGDRQVYLDTSFFDEMRQRLGGGGDFANAYVIAHEVGHHVQTLTGTTQKVQQARAAGQSVEGDGGLLVRQELQADCYAGVWAHVAEQRLHWLEEGDVERALATASAIGDDRLQREARGTVVPDAFTHGTSEQRVRWFRRGFESGEPQRCDTFAAADL